MYDDLERHEDTPSLEDAGQELGSYSEGLQSAPEADEQDTSFMVTVEVLIPGHLDPDDLSGEIETAVENELPGPLDIFGEGDRDDLELDIGAVGSIDPGLIDDGLRWRRAAGERFDVHPLLAAKLAVAQTVLESRSAIEMAVRATYDMDGLTVERGELQDILEKLDAWHTASIATLQPEGA